MRRNRSAASERLAQHISESIKHRRWYAMVAGAIEPREDGVVLWGLGIMVDSVEQALGKIEAELRMLRDDYEFNEKM